MYVGNSVLTTTSKWELNFQFSWFSASTPTLSTPSNPPPLSAPPPPSHQPLLSANLLLSILVKNWLSQQPPLVSVCPRPPLFFLFLRYLLFQYVRTYTLNCKVNPGARHAAAGRLGCCLTCITSRLMFRAFLPYPLQPSKPAMAVPLSWVGGSHPRWRPPSTAGPRFQESWWELGGTLAARNRHRAQRATVQAHVICTPNTCSAV